MRYGCQPGLLFFSIQMHQTIEKVVFFYKYVLFSIYGIIKIVISKVHLSLLKLSLLCSMWKSLLSLCYLIVVEYIVL